MLITTLAVGMACGMALGTIPCCEHSDCVVSASSITLQSEEKTADVQVNYPNAPKITAKAGFILEANSGKILYAHNAEQHLPIASMTKVATLGVIYDALATGKIKMDDLVMVSERASSMGGSQAFLDAGSEYSVRDLIQSIVVASANDSCVQSKILLKP